MHCADTERPLDSCLTKQLISKIHYNVQGLICVKHFAVFVLYLLPCNGLEHSILSSYLKKLEVQKGKAVYPMTANGFGSAHLEFMLFARLKKEFFIIDVFVFR